MGLYIGFSTWGFVHGVSYMGLYMGLYMGFSTWGLARALQTLYIASTLMLTLKYAKLTEIYLYPTGLQQIKSAVNRNTKKCRRAMEWHRALYRSVLLGKNV